MDIQSFVDKISHNWFYVTIAGFTVFVGVLFARLEAFLRILGSLFRIKEQIRQSKQQELDSLRTLAENRKLPKELRHAAHEDWVSRVFSRISGIKTDSSKMAQVLADIHNRYPSDASWKDLKRASHFIKLRNGHPEVVIRKRVKFFFWFSRLYAIVVTIFALSLLMLFNFYGGIPWQIWVVVLFMLACAGFYGYLPSLPCESAMKIRRLLESEE